jgi:hypothetical protein
MSQISPPIRILLVGSVLLAAVWVLLLKPKADDGGTTAATPATPAVTAPGAAQDGTAGNTNTKLGAAVEAAKGAAATSDQANNAVQKASGGEADVTSKPSTSSSTTTTPAPTQESAPATTDEPADPAVAKLPDWLQSSLDKKVVAILFWNKDASDDRRTNVALKDAYKAHGKVVTHSVPIDKISKYGAVARGVDVSQSPTLMVIDRDRKATALVGYANVEAINQAIIDGLLATDNPAAKVPVVKVMQTACQGFVTSSEISAGDFTMKADYRADLATVGASLTETLKQAPALRSGPYSAQAKLLRSYVKSERSILNQVRPAKGDKGTVDSRSIRQAQAKNDKLEARASLELNAIGVNGCN